MEQLAAPEMKQKKNMVIVGYQPQRQMTFCAAISTSTNLALALCMLSPSSCLD